MSRPDFALDDDVAAAYLERLRDAERDRAIAVAQLAERDSQLAALRRRVALTEQRSAETKLELSRLLSDSEARRSAAESELQRATGRADDAQRALDELRTRLEQRIAAAEQTADAAVARASRDERAQQAQLAGMAAERARLLARIAALERRQGIDGGGQTRSDDDVELLVAELTRSGDELAAAREELEAARDEIARMSAAQKETAERPAPPEPAPLTEPAHASTDLAHELQELRSERDALELAARASRGEHTARIRELEQLVSILSLALAATRDDITRAEQSRAWRMGHGMTRTAARVAGRPDRTDGALAAALRRIEEIQQATHALPGTPGERPVVVSQPPLDDEPVELAADALAEQRALLAADIRGRLGPAQQLDAWPAVSIVVPTHNGAQRLRRLVDGLRTATDYPELELVVIDNDSEDETRDWLEQVSRDCLDQVPELPLRVIANTENVSYSQANAQGAQLAAHPLLLFANDDVEPFERGWLRELVAAHVLGESAITGATLLHTERSRRSADGQLVQHRAVGLRRTSAGVQPYNDGDGGRLFGPGFGIEQPALAVSGACLLIAASALEQLGGWSSRYRYGLEDVDLALRAGRAGLRVATTGRAVLYHEQSATRLAEGPDFTRATRETNRRALQEMWGPQLRGTYAAARLGGDPTPVDDAGPHAAITVTSLSAADGWGDWYTAHELGDALQALGWRVSYLAVGRGDGAPELPNDLDYVVTLLDRFDARAVPADVGVIAWIRNWTERWLQRPWFERLDVVLASTPASVELVEERTGLRPVLFPLATNPDRFARAVPDPARAVDCVFTGNHWGQRRAIEAGIAPPRGQTLAIHGQGWEKIRRLTRHHAGVADYDELPALYASAKLVLDDTQEPTLRYDAVNARVFDALAAGSLVLTNCAAGARELFDDDFPVWGDAAELRAQRDALLADDERRTVLADRYREVVLTRHTYAHRANRLIQVLREREALPSFCIKIGAPDWEQAQRWGDLHFARALIRELRRRGHRCLIQVLEEWEQPAGLPYDVVVHLKGLSRHHPKPGQLNILWCISHPDELRGEECDGYDLVAVASEAFAGELRGRTDTQVIVLDQATDPATFFPDPDPDPAAAHELLYVANSRNVLRPILRDLLPTEHDLAVYGANWDGLVDRRIVRGEHVPNEELRRLYSSASIVLADHWDDMRAQGFVSNRIYDALACGAFVISDDVRGLAERFDRAVAVYRTPQELRGLVATWLADPRGRAARGAAGRRAVLAGGTFADRVEVLLATLARSRQAAGEAA